MEEVVCDASTIAKWFLEESNAKNALQLQQAYVEKELEIHAPMLLPFEVLNALRYSEMFNIDELQTIAQSLSHYGITMYPLHGQLAKRSLDIALNEDITVYDASYVALAVLHDTICYTADSVLLQKLSKKKSEHVYHISTFE